MQLKQDLSSTVDLIGNWESFKNATYGDPILRPITIKPWKSSKDPEIKPRKMKYTFLQEEVLKQELTNYDYLIRVATPYMQYISASLIGIPHLIALSDEYGWILALNGTIDELGGKNLGICIGANWNEKNIGHNGIGTALVIQKPVFIYGIEQCIDSNNTFSCLGVPIRKNDEIVGAFAVVVPTEYASPSRIAIALTCVNSIENEIKNVLEKGLADYHEKNMLSISDIIATAVHDLKNPIAVIRGLGDLGILVTKSEKERQYFKRIIHQSDILNSIVIDLLSIFKPQPPSIEKPSDLIKDVLTDIEPLCSMKNIQINFLTQSNRKINLFVMQFKRALLNLIDNAIKVMPDGGIINIEIKDNGNELLISLSDTGPGIPHDIKDNLFQAYTFRSEGGTGLGLFMTHHVITNIHNGQIWFESIETKGTTFFISLPM